jgi:hypothetical protein
MIEQKNTRSLILIEDAEDTLRKMQVPVPPRSNVVVQPSGISGLEIAGSKCVHGVYIPANSDSPDHALYCSECYNYILKAKSEHAIFKA